MSIASPRIWKQVVTNIIQYEWRPPEGNKNDKDKVLDLNINCYKLYNYQESFQIYCFENKLFHCLRLKAGHIFLFIYPDIVVVSVRELRGNKKNSAESW